ncbi:MerC domain-containing protein [Shewanella sp. KT0246]|uniref:MerC domain-containing protein n=1 Tax=Shewanella sp. KT0246 TaxID=2815912 RepID=UPI001BBACF66|nr:MerC domain-containing protein [Shewanella sp. KT0246]GIU53668.1 membrane protein [Shewanella sp. KT0246]
MNKPAQLLLDRLAISASGLCVLHCLAGPILLVLFPAMSSLSVSDHFYHILMLWFIIPTSSIAMFLGFSRHKDPVVLGLAFVGMGVLTVAAIYGHDWIGHTGEKLATLAATFILASAHWRNYSLCRNDTCEH